MQRYEIKEGAQNARPLEPMWPIWFIDGFYIVAKLDESCWCSAEDRDDWNELGGLTSAFSADNSSRAMLAWRPGNILNTFVVTGCTNDRRGNSNTHGDSVVLQAGERVFATITFDKGGLFEPDRVQYEIETESGQEAYVEHQFSIPFHRTYKQIGSSLAGAALQNMAMHYELTAWRY